MSTYYLLDQFEPAMPITDVTSSRSGQVNATGAVVVKVPAGLPIEGMPSNLEELIDAKRSALLALYSSLERGFLDPCLSGDFVDPLISQNVRISAGGRNHCVQAGGTLVTTELTLASVPLAYMVVWEAYTISESDAKSGLLTSVFHDADPSLFSCNVTFFELAPVAVRNAQLQQGSANSTLTLAFTNNSDHRLFLGSWAILYKPTPD